MILRSASCGCASLVVRSHHSCWPQRASWIVEVVKVLFGLMGLWLGRGVACKWINALGLGVTAAVSTTSIYGRERCCYFCDHLLKCFGTRMFGISHLHRSGRLEKDILGSELACGQPLARPMPTV